MAYGESGFTLIEVLIVTAVIGILAAIALPSFLRQTDSARDAETKSYVRHGQTGIEMLAAGRGDFSITREELLDEVPELEGAATLSYEMAGDGYRLTVSAGARSRAFTIGRVDRRSPAARTCSPAGDGGCRDDGTW